MAWDEQTRKYVYLYELDSVRKTDKEIAIGQTALYNEIIQNGNIVVLTYNQLVDSRGFFSLLANKRYYDCLIALFENGAIRVSQYGNIRTIVQYILNSIDDEDNRFIYSALPLKYSQRRLTALVRRSLINSDLSEIYRYKNMADCGNTAEIKDLFVEVGENSVEESRLSVSDMKNILENLYWLLSAVMRLSTLHDIYIPPKPAEEYEKYHLGNFLKKIISENIMDGFLDAQDMWFKEAQVIISKLVCYGKNSRSLYLRELKEFSDRFPEKKTACMYAEAIIDLCYNYACEMSICNISKHYNISDFDGNSGTSFQEDFKARLSLYWDEGVDAERKFLQKETNQFKKFVPGGRFPDFYNAVRLTTYVDFSSEAEAKEIKRYEYDLERQKACLKKDILRKLEKKLRIFFLYILLAVIINIVMQIIQNLVDEDMSFMESIQSTVMFGIETVIFLCLGEFVTTMMAKQSKKFMSLSNAIKGVGDLISDYFSLLRPNACTYVNEKGGDLSKSEKYSEGSEIDYYESMELKKYRTLKSHRGNLFSPSSVYPIADTTDKETIKQLMRQQELFNYKFGIAYKSRFNMMIVDPIIGSNNFCYPYERVATTAEKDGVVVIVVHNGRFVLLKQFRHAIRKTEYSFPRGYAENGENPEESAMRELLEEISAVITKPLKFMGRVSADSGLLCGRVYIYLAEVNQYTCNAGHEGILEVEELREDELVQWIREGKIEDGFTLAAYSLYSCGFPAK